MSCYDFTVSAFASVQAAIDAARDAGGGRVMFPPGTYTVAIDPVLGYALRLYTDVSLVGVDRALCTIKLADDQGEYKRILGHEFTDPLDNVTVSGLTFDHNLENNLQTTPPPDQVRQSVGIWKGDNVTIQDCRFTNFISRQTLILYGYLSNIRIERNLFDNVNSDVPDDYSAIYTKTLGGGGVWIRGNVFQGDPVAHLGAHTAIETHGSNQYVMGNLANGFRIGAIISGICDHSEMMTVTDNHFVYCQYGLQLWSQFSPDDEHTEGPGLRGCRVEGNHITIDLDAWEFTDPGAVSGKGIMVHYLNDSATYDLSIYGNIVRFLPYTVGLNVNECNTVAAVNGQADLDCNWMIAGNTLVGSPGNAIRIEPTVENLVIGDNIEN